MFESETKPYINIKGGKIQGLLFLEFNSKIKLGDQLKNSEQSKILGDL